MMLLHTHPDHGLAIYEVASQSSSDEPLRNPLGNLDKIRFHSSLPYARVVAYQAPVRVVLPQRSGSGYEALRIAGWPAAHGGGRGARGILLIGSKPRSVSQHVLGDVTPKGYGGKNGTRWRRLSLIVGSRCEIGHMWQAEPGAGVLQESVYLGYILVTTEVPSRSQTANPLHIAPHLADPFIRMGVFDSRRSYYAITAGRGDFRVVYGETIAGAKGKGIKIVKPDGGLVLRGKNAQNVPTPQPARYWVTRR